MKICDLHTHSTCSDGSFTPEEIVRAARGAGLSAVALTDHNTAEGLPAFFEAGEKYGVETVAGCEFSTDWRGKELHIVGLCFPRENWREIADYVDLARLAKDRANRDMIARLAASGYDVSYEEASALSDSAVFNRSHVARVLVNKGYVRQVKEAFDTLLREGGGFYLPAKRLGALATVRFIRMYGGRAVLAHPFLNLNGEELRIFLPEAKKEGLDALETRYTEFDAAQTAAAEALAEEYGLLQSGGSDFHGTAKPGIALGRGRGDLVVPYAFYERLARNTGGKDRGGRQDRE